MTNRNPKFYGLIYFSLIPIFAFIYLLLPSTDFKGDLSMDNFLTCFYFSTVTITTLGFGDISAISELAQFFVIIEAIFGVLSIGLFLNSLSIQYSEKISIEEKKKESDNKFRLECEKLIRHNNIIEQNVNLYLLYIYEITTPLSKRKGTENGFTLDFPFNDLKDLYHPSMRMADNRFEPAIKYFYQHQKNLEESIKDLILDINTSYWKDFEIECINFLNNCKNYDYSSSILSQFTMSAGELKMKDEASKMIEKHSGEVEFRPSSMMNQYVALYKLIKLNLKFIEYYGNKIIEIKNKFA